MVTHKELLLYFERNLKKCANKNGKIDIKDVERETNIFLGQVEADMKESQPIKKFIFVEDGSVDVDELEETLYARNPEIKVVVYSQGSRAPGLVDVNEVE